jgi:exodeoxyribonuclease-5
VRAQALTPKQELAKDAVLRWFKDPRGKQTFYFAGFGGTGKSTCVEHIVREIEGRVLYAAFTGKAASVMRRKNCPGASTIHRLAYRPAGDPPTQEQLDKTREEINRLYAANEPGAKATADKLVEALKHDEESSQRKGPRFSLNHDSEIKYAKLVVIDECSFVDGRVGADLESFGTKLLVLGDPAQLPPVYGAGYFTSREPDVFLDEILRQELDNPIRQLCEKARRGERLSIGKYGDSEVVRYGDPSVQDKVLAADIVIVGRNRTRHACNTKIRRLLGRGDSPAPVEGDRVVCLRNDHELGLLNGTQWTVDRCLPDFDKLTASIDITSVDDDDRVDRLECDAWLHHFMAREDELAITDRRKRVELDFGNAITCHRSQGSEWPNVVVFDEANAFGANAFRWRYTAFSRASRSLVVVQ